METGQITGHPLSALGCTILSVGGGIFASIITNVDLYVRIGAGLIAVASGIMAIRYYYYATKEKIKTIKT